MLNEYINELINHAQEHDIAFNGIPLAPFSKSFSDSESQTIFINMNWYDTYQIPLIISHEIGHLENGDVAVPPSTFTVTTNDPKREYRATKTGLSILMPIYLQLTDEAQANPYHFMEQFHVEDKFVDAVIEIMNSAYNAA